MNRCVWRRERPGLYVLGMHPVKRRVVREPDLRGYRWCYQALLGDTWVRIDDDYRTARAAMGDQR